MADEQYTLELGVIDKISGVLGSAAKGLDKLGTAAGATDAQLQRMDRTLPRIASQLKDSQTKLQQVAAASKGFGANVSAEVIRVQAALTRLSSWNPQDVNGKFTSVANASSKSIQDLVNRVQEYQRALNAVDPSKMSGTAKGARDAAVATDQASASMRRYAAAVSEGARASKVMWDQQRLGSSLARNMAYLPEQGSDGRRVGSSFGAIEGDISNAEHLTNRLITLRYALYGAAIAVGAAGTMLFKASQDVFSTAISWERNFADVERTSGATGVALKNLRADFLDLQRALPVSSADLAEIGTLAGQMGVATGRIAEFTRVTAMFSAASGVSVDETATALARLDSLLPDVNGNYATLASTILKTGVNAVATERQIIRGVTQIAAIGQVAGLTTPEVVALSSALSSMGMSPELQRSVVTSSFSRIMAATGAVTSETEKYGSVLGITGSQFKQMWDSDAYGTWSRLMTAISKRSDAVTVLKDLGLASQRLTPNLLKAGQGAEILADALADTTSEWGTVAELTYQYGVISEKVASKITRFSNSWEAFLVSVGDGGVIFGGIIDAGSELLKVFSDLAETPVVGELMQFVAIAAGVAGAAAIVGAAGLIGFAGVLSMQTALVSLNATLVPTSIGLRGLIGQLTAAGAAGVGGSAGLATFAGVSQKAGAAVGVLSKALGVLTVAWAALSALPSVDKWLDDTFGGPKKTLAELTQMMAGGKELSEELQRATGRTTSRTWVKPLIDFSTEGWTSWFGEFQRTMDSINLGGLFGVDSASPIRRLEEYDKVLADLSTRGDSATVLEEVGKVAAAQGISVDQVLSKLPDTRNALEAYAEAMGMTTDEAYALAESERVAAEAADVLRTKLGIEDLEAYVSAIQSGSAAWIDYKSNLEAAYKVDDPETDEDESGGGFSQFADTLAKQVQDLSAWQDDLKLLSARGATALTQAFAEEGPASRQALSDALTLGPEELSKVEENARMAAFLSSKVFAEEFTQTTGTLIDVYRATNEEFGMAAVDAVNKAMNDGISNAEALILSQKYGIDVEILTSADFTETDYLVANKARELAGLPPIPMPIGADLTPAQETLAAYTPPTKWMTVDVQINGYVGKVFGTAPEKPGIATGGLIRNGDVTMRGYARGGPVWGSGTATSDSVPAWLSNGEFVMNAAAVRHYGAQLFDQLNRRQMPAFAQGGPVSVGPTGGGHVTNVRVIQNNPVTRDPLKQLRKASEDIVTGMWS